MVERIAQINPRRLRWCCDDRGISIVDLAHQANVAEGALQKTLRGEEGLTFKQLQRVARVLGRGVLFLVDPAPVEDKKVRPAQFRTLANQKPMMGGEVRALIERVTRLREGYLDLREEQDAEDWPRFDPPNVKQAAAAQAAAAARQWLKLDEHNDFASYRAAVETAGVFVFFSTGYAGAWKVPPESKMAGFSLFYEDCPVIAVRKQQFATRQSFTLMHELGHLLLHRDSFIDDEADLYTPRGREREANAFAGHLLVPDAWLSRIDMNQRPAAVEELDDWLEPYRKTWGVSGEVILRRLLDSRRIDRALYQRYRQHREVMVAEKPEGGKRWRDREPMHLFGTRYVHAVLDALHTRQITLNKASGLLDNLKISDVHKLERHLAGH